MLLPSSTRDRASSSSRDASFLRASILRASGRRPSAASLWALLCAGVCTGVLTTACVDDATASSTVQASTDPQARGGGGRPHRGPPQEAITACAGASAGDACRFTIDGHDVTGTCRTAPDGQQGPLACAPEHPPGQGPGGEPGGGGDAPPGPPQEAIAACDGAAAGDACAFTIDGHDLTGTCRAAPDGQQGPLACAPDQPPPRR